METMKTSFIKNFYFVKYFENLILICFFETPITMKKLIITNS